jgi:hypothetical protein
MEMTIDDLKYKDNDIDVSSQSGSNKMSVDSSIKKSENLCSLNVEIDDSSYLKVDPLDNNFDVEIKEDVSDINIDNY